MDRLAESPHLLVWAPMVPVGLLAAYWIVLALVLLPEPGPSGAPDAPPPAAEGVAKEASPTVPIAAPPSRAEAVPADGPVAESKAATNAPAVLAENRWRPTRDGTTAQLRGTFGDMFGAANALFSALAFGCVFLSLMLQRSELRVTRAIALGALRLEARVALLDQCNELRREARAAGRPHDDLDRQIIALAEAVEQELRGLGGPGALPTALSA